MKNEGSRLAASRCARGALRRTACWGAMVLLAGAACGSAPGGGSDGGPFLPDGGASIDGGPGGVDGGGAPDGGSPSSDGGTTVLDGGPTTDGGSDGASGFAAPARWSVPPSGLSDGFFTSAWSSGSRYWITLDLDGDRRPDLVHTADASNGSGVVWQDGAGAYWKVYRNTGSGFAPTTTRWAVPPSGLSDGFFGAYWSSGSRYWATQDMDGDGRPDLVHTADSSNGSGVVWEDTAGPYWKVYRNTGTGFASTATRWTVPPSGLSDGFFATGWSLGSRYWVTRDLDGDRRPDLVHTADSSNGNGVVWQDGSGAYWKVYRNTGTGFASTATRWAVPPSGLSDGFFASAWSAGSRYWSTLDLDGDGKPDLAHTADSSSGDGVVWGDGSGAYWKVYRNTGTGFMASATRWAVPPSGRSDGFFGTFWSSGSRYWATIDLDGDARPDLAHTADSSDSGGVVWQDGSGAYWKVYRNTGTGFAGSATRWAVPDTGLSDGFFGAYWGSGARYWSTFDLDGDGRADLLHTADSSKSGGVVWSDGSGAFWKVARSP